MMTSDLSGKVIVVVGGDGFFGRHLAQVLLRSGARVRIASRHPERAFRLKPLGNLGQMQFVRADITRKATLERAVAGAWGVVNLVGAFRGDLVALHEQGPGDLAEVAATAGVQALVQVSALGANPDSDSRYARTKAGGERAVLAEFPRATILRPSVLFGPDDRFTNLFAGLIAGMPAMPVFAPQSRLQPVFVDDAAEAVVAALADPSTHGGKTYEIVGPEAISMAELNRRVSAAQHRRRCLIPLPNALSGVIAAATGWLPFAPLSSDQWAMLKRDNIASGQLPGLRELGITPKPLGLFLDRWMERYRKNGRFGARTSAVHR